MIHRTRIKICGITSPADAALAASAGADAAGLVFHPPAPRNVAREVAGEILRALPAFVTAVGLFVDRPVEVILETVAALGLRHVQLHGDEGPELIAELGQKRPGLVVLKAVKVTAGRIEGELERWREAAGRLPLHGLRGLVLETGGTKEAGGTGVENDWEAIRRLRERGAFAGLPPIIAAGGLTPENVGKVVRLLRPWAVDVSSGVEAAKGRKSPEKVEAFVRAVREADAGRANQTD